MNFVPVTIYEAFSQLHDLEKLAWRKGHGTSQDENEESGAPYQFYFMLSFIGGCGSCTHR